MIPYQRTILAVIAAITFVECVAIWWVASDDNLERPAYAQEEDRDFSEECTNVVETFEGTGETETELFQINTNEWRIFAEFPNVEPGVQLFLTVLVENERGESVEAELEFLVEGPPDFDEPEETEPPNSSAYIVSSVPGQFRLSILPDSLDRPWRVTVAECGAATDGGQPDPQPIPDPQPTPSPQPNPQPIQERR